jgi:hypothetical protein
MNASLEKIRRVNPGLATRIESQGYCVTEKDLPEILEIDPAIKVLVRTNMGRFTTTARDVKHFLQILTEHGRVCYKSKVADHVRDVSLAS